MHDEVIRYHLEGTLSDKTNIVKHKETLVQTLEAQMRDEGCIPSLDIEPHFTLEYRAEDETYVFEVSVYGVWQGQDAWDYSGKSYGTTHLRHSLSHKQKQSSPPAM